MSRGRFSARRAPLLAGGLCLLALGSAMGFMLGCRRQEGVFPGSPIVLITIDTLRSDRLPAYGYHQVATPALDRLAREGIVFERAYAHTPLTLPSHVSILTGELPSVHQVRDNTGYAFDATRHPYLPRLLRDAGYATGAAVSSFVLRTDTGLGQGFDFYGGDLKRIKGATIDAIQRAGPETAASALEWLRTNAEQPFFLFLHLYEPHTPYEPPPPFAARYAHAYDGEIATADAVVGTVLAELERLGRYDQTLIALTADHGESLGEHGESQHGVFLYRATLQVPLILKLPGGARAGTRVGVPAQLVDIAPTLLRAAGIEPPAGLPGTPLLELAAQGPARAIYSETFYPRIHFGWSDLASLISGRFQYIEAPRPELFDLTADPAQSSNLIEQERREYAQLKAELAKYDRRLVAPAPADAETVQQLAALGYLGGAAAFQAGPLPDPKDHRPTLLLLDRAAEAMRQNRSADAAAAFRQALTASPNMPSAWHFYAESLWKLDRREEAVVADEQALKTSGGDPNMALAVASRLLEVGKLDQAEERARLAQKSEPKSANALLAAVARARGDQQGSFALMRQAVADDQANQDLRREYAQELILRGASSEALAVLTPLDPEAVPATLTIYGTALSNVGRHQEALEILDRALAAEPELGRAHEARGIVVLRLGRPEEARRSLERAVQLNDRLGSAWNTLGVARFQLGDATGALAAWKQAVAIRPDNHEAWFNLALVAADTGKRGEARGALRHYLDTAPAADTTGRRRAESLLRELGG